MSSLKKKKKEKDDGFICLSAECVVEMGAVASVPWLCASLYKHEGQDPILTEEADPLQVFEACEIDKNEFRFIPFVLWLKKQPSCFYWFERIRETLPQRVPGLKSLLRLRLIRFLRR